MKQIIVSVFQKIIKLGLAYFKLALWILVLGVLLLPYQAYRAFIPENNQKSAKVSKFFRKVFEYKGVKKAVGLGVAMLLILSNFISRPLAAANDITQEAEVIPLSEEKLVTENSLNKPFEGVVGQGYHAFHRAIDILAPVGTEIKAINNGQVIEASFGRLGYGNTIVVDHGNNLTSRYAHLDQIKVSAGNSVDKQTVIGTVGMTGWTTGPHLHLEIYENGRAINPALVLPEFGSLVAYGE